MRSSKTNRHFVSSARKLMVISNNHPGLGDGSMQVVSQSGVFLKVMDTHFVGSFT